MQILRLANQVYKIGAIDWNRRLFDCLIPLPKGTSYNSYLVEGSEKTALLDAVDPTKWAVLEENLSNIKKLDYVIAHHGEQDHSGSLPMVLAKYPEAKIVTNAKAQEILMDLLPLPKDRFLIVEEGSELSLGDKTLKFFLTPWVHWPETMVTYLVEDKILFSCDFFGSHLATTRLFAGRDPSVFDAAKRYYAEIMMPFAMQVQKNVEKVEKLDIRIIAPSHGPIYNDPSFIMEAYKEWNTGKPANRAIILYVSMHGSCEKMAEHLTNSLVNRGIEAKVYDLTVADVGDLAMDLVDAATLILATPIVLGSAHPLAMYFSYVANILKPSKLRFIAGISSYSWGGNIESLKTMLNRLNNVEWLPPVMSKGFPKKETFDALDKLAELIAQKHNAMNESK